MPLYNTNKYKTMNKLSTKFNSEAGENLEKFFESFASKLNSVNRCSPAYASSQKHLGEVAFNKGDFFNAAYNFQESFGPGLRTYVNLLCDKKIRPNERKPNVPFELSPNMQILEEELLEMNPKTTKWNDGLVDFCFKHYKKVVESETDDGFRDKLPDPYILRETMAHKYINSWSVECMKTYNEDLPDEWTIVQITKGIDIKDDTGPYETHFLKPTPIYITLFSGENIKISDHKPITICIRPSNEPGAKFVPSEILSVIEVYKNLNKTKYDNRQKYWQDLHQAEDSFKKLLRELNEWTGAFECLFLGKLKTEQNKKDYQLICREVDNCISDFSIKEHERILIHRLAAYSNSNSLKLVGQSLELILPGPKHKDIRRVLKMLFNKNWHSNEPHYKNMKHAERFPVILIVDEILDKIPWELLPSLAKQEISRVHSLHLLHALYYRNKDFIRQGYYIQQDIRGEIILNAACDLPKMEMRMSAFSKYWLADWPATIGRKPTEKEYAEMLQRCTVFVYAGHGGGAQYLLSENLEKNNLNCVALLSGCSSTTLTKEGRTESFGLHLSYHIAGSPCVIGNQWVVTDTDSDLLMTRILSTWIPGPKGAKHFIECNLDFWESGIIDPIGKPGNTKRRPLLGPFYPEILSERNLLKVLAISRGYASSIFNIAAIVARGIPVRLSYTNYIQKLLKSK